MSVTHWMKYLFCKYIYKWMSADAFSAVIVHLRVRNIIWQSMLLFTIQSLKSSKSYFRNKVQVRRPLFKQFCSFIPLPPYMTGHEQMQHMNGCWLNTHGYTSSACRKCYQLDKWWGGATMAILHNLYFTVRVNTLISVC